MAICAGSPAITKLYEFIKPHCGIRWVEPWAASLSNDCAMSLVCCGATSALNCVCPWKMSQPENWSYCACPAAIVCTALSNPMYWPFESLTTLGCCRTWYSEV